MKTIQKLETHSPSKEDLLSHCVYRIFRYVYSFLSSSLPICNF